MISSLSPDFSPQIGGENQPILEIQGLSVTFPGENGGLEAIQNMTFSVEPQEFICLLGPSGSGKKHPAAGPGRFAGTHRRKGPFPPVPQRSTTGRLRFSEC